MLKSIIVKSTNSSEMNMSTDNEKTRGVRLDYVASQQSMFENLTKIISLELDNLQIFYVKKIAHSLCC